MPLFICSEDRLELALQRKARIGQAGAAESTVLASGRGWRVVDVLCTSGPNDRPFEERYWSMAISLVVAGTFSYRSAQGASLLSPGAFLLGNAGSAYECSHEHGEGDRCLSFQFDAALFEDLARDAGMRSARFEHPRLPPLREMAPLTARALTALRGTGSFEEIALEIAVAALRQGKSVRDEIKAAARDRNRIAEVLRHIEANPSGSHRLDELSRAAGLSQYHFLRTFRSVTGLTPHQWLLRARLRHAARSLAAGEERITDLALGAGFEDLSNFVRSFRAEFGMPPGKYRQATRKGACRGTSPLTLRT